MKPGRDGHGSAPAFRLSDASFTYLDGENAALAPLSLEAEVGERIALLGPSGAGKSTFCRALNGLIPHFHRGKFSGSIAVFGMDTAAARVPELAQRVGLIFQDFESQLFSTSAELEVAFGPENFRLPPEEIRARVSECLKVVGLSGCERRHPVTLSGGEKQRLAIAAVLAGGPDLLLLDEATTDLDPVGKAGVLDVLQSLASADGGKPSTLVLVTDDAEEAAFAQRALVLEGGRLVADGPMEDVFSDPSWLEGHGVRPPDFAALFAALRLPERPREVGDAADALRRHGRSIDGREWEKLLQRESAACAKGEPVVEITGLSYCYPGGERALSGVDLTVREGELVALIGPNGSGKTTLAKHLNRLLEPTEGEVRIAGKPTVVRSRRQLAERVGYVFQNPDHQIFADAIFDEVAFGPRNFGLDPGDTAARVREALEAVGLSGREQEDPFSLTKGERQRAAVASMLAARPEIMVFDEPTTGLDYRESRGMMDLISELHARGHTVVIITHTMWVVAEYAQRAVVMRQGRIVADEPVRRVLGESELLASASVVAPPITRLGETFGRPFRSVAEAARLLRCQ